MQAPMRDRCTHSTRRPEKSSGRSPAAARSSMHRRFSTDSSTGVPVIGTSRPESGTTKCSRLPSVPGRRTKKATGRAGSRLATGRAAHEGRRPLSVIFYQGRDCHALGDTGGKRGPSLDEVAVHLTHDQLIRQVVQGGGNMPAYGKNLSPAENTAL